MKKFLGIIVSSLMWCNLSIAEITFMEGRTFGDVTYATVCIDGYKFTSSYEYGQNAQSVSITQFFKEDDGGGSVPAKC